MLSPKLATIEEQYHDLEQRLADPEVIRAQDEYQKLMKEHAELTPLIQAFRRYKQVKKELADSQSLIKEEADEELKDLAREEVHTLKEQLERLEEELRLLLLPKDPNDAKNVLLEIRAGTGGEEAGRIHTSAVTVAVLPEAEDVDVQISPEEIRIDVFRSSGPGGQSVNTTDSAVRITHVPTGLVVTCQDEKSQHKNKAKALKVLKARLFDLKQQEQHRQIAQERKSQVGTGDRSERIRTYNFPQGRVTDHRIGLTLYRLEAVLDGDLEELLGGLSSHFRAQALQQA